MGESPAIRVQPGQALRIATGGMLPPGADAVVMVEYCHDLDDRTIEVSRTVSPLENVIQPDDDVRKGCSVLPAGGPACDPRIWVSWRVWGSPGFR